MQRKRRNIVLGILIPLVAFLGLGSWAYASPPAASPDSDFHLASIYCGLGYRAGLCEVAPSGEPDNRLLPGEVVFAANCYATLDEQSASCWDAKRGQMLETDRLNSDGLYPPVFYAVMGVFASKNVEATVIAQRLFNVAFIVGVLTAVFWALPRRMRPALIVSMIATSVPLGVFLYASSNPSSWAILSGAIVWITLYAATQTEGKRRIVLALLSVFGTFIGAGARADSAAYACLAVAAAAILGLRWRRGMWIPAVAALASVAISAYFYLNAWQANVAVTGLEPDKEVPLTKQEIVMNALNIPQLWVGVLGTWRLGWLDTYMPDIVPAFSIIVFGATLFLGVKSVGWRRGFALALVLLALWVIPFYLLLSSQLEVGEFVQPRYLLPMLVMFTGIASLRWDLPQSWLGFRSYAAATALVVSFTVAFRISMQRYLTGTDDLRLFPETAAEWWWKIPAPTPSLVWVGGTIAFAVMLGLLIRAMRLMPAENDELSLAGGDAVAALEPARPEQATAAGSATKVSATKVSTSKVSPGTTPTAAVVDTKPAAAERSVDSTTPAPSSAAATPVAVVGSTSQTGSFDATAAKAALGKTVTLNDLTVVEGIGPKIQDLCHAEGITTWRQLADTEVGTLRTMLHEAGPRFQMHDPSTWPRQAGLLADGRWDEFATLTDELDGGRLPD